MNAPAPAPLRSLHLFVLAVIVACAVAVALQPAADPEPPPDPQLTWWVAGLAFVTIAGRLMSRSPVASPGLRRHAGIASLLAAVGIALIAVEVAVRDGAVRTGLGFSAGAFILALRPPFATTRATRDGSGDVA